jgi:hypothetical protein
MPRQLYFCNRCWIHLLFIGLCLIAATTSTEVKWTANEADSEEGNSGPLPLSSKQRQQLLKLDEVIRTSPNPEATLKQAADANGMSPQDLASMLQRNRSDLEQGVASAGGSGISSTLGGNLKRLITAVVALIVRSASHNPKAFALVTTTLLLLLFLAIAAPRTGLELSRHRGLLSKGPTTVLQPPTKFLEKRLGSAQWHEKDPKSGDSFSARIWKELTPNEDGAEWLKLPKQSELAHAATARITISIQDFLQDDENDDEAFCHELCYNHAVDVLNSQVLTEFVPKNNVRLYTLQKGDSGRKRFSALIVNKVGDWGRWGIMPVQITQKQENDLETSLTYTSLKGSHFAGQIRVSAEKIKAKKGTKPSVVLLVQLAIPKKAHRISSRAAVDIVESLSHSVVASVKTRTSQSLARRSQSSSFKNKTQKSAEDKRHIRFQKEKELEEMAEDRRRKWQRNNPNSGRYRPSGDRQRSPNNC